MLFKHTFYIVHTFFIHDLLGKDFAKDFVGSDSISTTGNRTQDRYKRKEHFGTRTRTQKDRKSALEHIDSHIDLPNEQINSSIHSGLQALLLCIQKGYFIEIHTGQHSIQTDKALRKVENTT